MPATEHDLSRIPWAASMPPEPSDDPWQWIDSWKWPSAAYFVLNEGPADRGGETQNLRNSASCISASVQLGCLDPLPISIGTHFHSTEYSVGPASLSVGRHVCQKDDTPGGLPPVGRKL